MDIPFLNSILSYLRGEGAVIVPEMELTLFGLGILLFGSSIGEAAEENWFWKLLFKNFHAKAALAGTLFSAYSLLGLRGAVVARGGFTGFHDSGLVDPFLRFFSTRLHART